MRRPVQIRPTAPQCLTCGGALESKYARKYCRIACSARANARQLAAAALARRGQRKAKPCEACGRDFVPFPHEYSVRRFCSRRCSRVAGNGGRKRSPDRPCGNCGKPVVMVHRMLAAKSVYCTRACYAAYRDLNPRAWTFEVFEGLRRRIDGQRLKRAMIRAGLREDKCERCGCPPIWNGAPLVIQPHHKNGDATDNRRENIELACPNCHSQTLKGQVLARRELGIATAGRPWRIARTSSQPG
jgi:hypothetical protein